MSPDAFAAYVKADIERWSKLVKDQKIEIES
jgi:tripartite-type tricarboxylate transporter receptor subunit TctC